MASVFTAMGIDDAEVWISDKRKGFGRVLAGEVPVICLGTDVAAGEGAAAMFTLGRCAQLAAVSAGALPELRDIEVAWLCAAALRASDVPLPRGLAGIAVDDDAAISERTRLLSKAFGRRDKKNVAAWASGTADSAAAASSQIDAPTLATWRRHTVGLANRVGMLLSGDPEVALELIDAGRSGRAIEDSTWAQDLARWTVSENHVALRAELTAGITKGAS